MIDPASLFEYCRALAAVRAPSGLESYRADLFLEQMRRVNPDLSFERDGLGNLIACIGPETPQKGKETRKVLLVAHLDEIGGTVYKIRKNGRLLFTKRGAFESRWLISRAVSIFTLKKTWVNGVILGRTIHAMPADARGRPVPDVHELEVYVGADSDEEVLRSGIHVGAPLVFENRTDYLNPEIDRDLVVSNSLDDIVGLLVLLELAARWKDLSLNNLEIIFAAVAREEVGREGSLYVGRNLHPDICLGFDFGVIESDAAGIDCGGTLKGGPMIVWAESDGKGILDYNLSRELVSLAQSSELPFQHGCFEYYGSDPGKLQKELGIPSALVAIPMLAGHNSLEVVALSEIGRAADLVDAWIHQHDR